MAGRSPWPCLGGRVSLTTLLQECEDLAVQWEIDLHRVRALSQNVQALTSGMAPQPHERELLLKIRENLGELITRLTAERSDTQNKLKALHRGKKSLGGYGSVRAQHKGQRVAKTI